MGKWHYFALIVHSRDLKGLLKNEFKSLFSKDYMEEPEVPNATDVLIIGGGLIGASAAYWLKSRAASGLSVTLVERDFGVCVSEFFSSLPNDKYLDICRYCSYLLLR